MLRVVSIEGILTDPSEVEKVPYWPVPTSTKEMQQFLGLSSYYRCLYQVLPIHSATAERNAVVFFE